MTDQSAAANTPLMKRRGLGRGLDALFEDTELRVSAPNPDGPAAGAASTPPMLSGGRVMLPLSNLEPGQFQPRKFFDDDALHELAQSIAQHGVIQPLLVRPLVGREGMYEIIAGERRWRAAMRAGVHDVPVVINTALTDREALQLGLIENIQREDLSAIEEAQGYKQLIDEFILSPERIGEMVGKSRAHIANMVRLLQLPSAVQEMVTRGVLSAGHARALIGAPQIEALAKQIIDKKLSVRQTEKLVGSAGRSGGSKGSVTTAPSSTLEPLIKELTDAVGMRVDIAMQVDHKAGQLRVDFKNLDQLDLLIKRLKGEG